MADRETQYAEAYAKLQQKTKLYEKEKEYLSLKLRKTLNDAHKQQLYYQDVEEKLSLVMRLLEERECTAADSIAHLETDLQNSKAREDELRSEVRQLHSTVSDLRTTIASSTTPLSSYQELASKHDALQQSLADKFVPREEYIMLQTTYHNLLHRMESTMVLREEYDMLLSKHNQKMKEIEGSTIDRSKYEALQEQYNHLKEHLAKETIPVTECNRLRDEAEKYLRQNELFEESFSILEEEKRLALSKVQECEQRISSLKSRIQLSSEEKADLHSKIEGQGTVIASLETEVSHLSTLLSDEREHKNKLLVENSAYTIRIAELQRSLQRSFQLARCESQQPHVSASASTVYSENSGYDQVIDNFDLLDDSDDCLLACEKGLMSFKNKLQESKNNR